MGFERRYLKSCHFVWSKATGELDDNALMEQVLALNSETEGMTDFKELSDCSELVSLDKLTVTGTTSCAAAEDNRSESLLAILVSDSPLLYGMARSYQMFAENNRQAVRIFTDMEAALRWLAVDETEVLQLMDFVMPAR